MLVIALIVGASALFVGCTNAAGGDDYIPIYENVITYDVEWGKRQNGSIVEYEYISENVYGKKTTFTTIKEIKDFFDTDDSNYNEESVSNGHALSNIILGKLKVMSSGLDTYTEIQYSTGQSFPDGNPGIVYLYIYCEKITTPTLMNPR
jgi:hypothetical protein